MRVRPGAFEPLGAQAKPFHMELIREYLSSTDGQRRGQITQTLQEQLGAVATARAIPKSLQFKSFGGRLVEGHARHQGRRLPYMAVLPEGYDPSRPWPMHIDLHGGGRAGTHMTCL